MKIEPSTKQRIGHGLFFGKSGGGQKTRAAPSSIFCATLAWHGSGKSVWCSTLLTAPTGIPWTADSSTFLFFAH